MISFIGGLARCMGGKHERSEAKVRRLEDDQFVSVCQYCRKPMRRLAKRKWVVDPTAR